MTASCIITKSLPFVTMWKSGKNSGGYDYCSWGYTLLSRNKCSGVALETHPRWQPRLYVSSNRQRQSMRRLRILCLWPTRPTSKVVRRTGRSKTGLGVNNVCHTFGEHCRHVCFVSGAGRNAKNGLLSLKCPGSKFGYWGTGSWGIQLRTFLKCMHIFSN